MQYDAPDFLDETPDFDRESALALESLLREGTRIACASSDFATALKNFLAAYPALVADSTLFGSADSALQRAQSLVLFREIWKRVPRPDHAFRPLPLPKAERNEPCQCGSGKKYKQCCASLDGAPPFDMQGLSLLKYVLEDIPPVEYHRLPFHQLSADELALVAEEWINEGSADAAVLLLAPLLADVKKLDERHERAVDTLGDAYLSLGLPEERVALVERFIDAPDTTLRCAAMHRRCTMHTDAGEYSAAWKLFAKAQHLQPNNPALSHLETLLLANEGRFDEAQERARYWLLRLAGQGFDSESAGAHPLMDFLRMMSRAPASVMAMISGEMSTPDFTDSEWLLPLVGMVETLREATCHYQLQPMDGNAGELMAAPELAALEAQWAGIFNEQSDEGDTDWIQWLTENPLAWQSFPILDDVASYLEVCEVPAGFDEIIVDMSDVILAHAEELLEQVIADNDAKDCRLEWGWLENRPALRLLERQIATLDDIEEEQRLLEWLVLTLNPTDNQGLRESLVRIYFEIDQPAEALALCERYPGDSLIAMPYARVLALHQLGRLDEAAAALAEAREKLPQVFATLAAEDPSEPELAMDSEALAESEEVEAWYYRMDWHYLWTDLGALDWLQQQSAA